MYGTCLIPQVQESIAQLHADQGGRPLEITDYVCGIVEQQMQADVETTAMQLHEYLKCFGILHTVLRRRQQLGWTFRGSAYCQLIRRKSDYSGTATL